MPGKISADDGIFKGMRVTMELLQCFSVLALTGNHEIQLFPVGIGHG